MKNPTNNFIKECLDMGFTGEIIAKIIGVSPQRINYRRKRYNIISYAEKYRERNFEKMRRKWMEIKKNKG